MAKKSKKNEIAAVEAEATAEVETTEINQEQTADATDMSADVQQEAVVDDALVAAPVEDKPKKEKKGGSAAGFKTAEIILYALSMPVLVIMTVISSLGVAAYAGEAYTFWPFVGMLIAVVLAIVVMVVRLCASRKKNHKSIRTQTTIMCIVTFCLTCMLGMIFDVALPDVLAKLASNTVRYETLQDDSTAQAELNGELAREFIRYNMFNGNYYDSEDKPAPFEYSALLKNDTIAGKKEVVGSIAYYKAKGAEKSVDANGNKTNALQLIIDGYKAAEEEGEKSLLVSKQSYDYELYSFIYNWYVMQDYSYAFNISGINDDGSLDVPNRQAVAVALTEYTKADHTRLCKEGIPGNARLTELITNNFASMDRDAYVVLDSSCMLSYAQLSGRMTVPVVIKLVLDSRYQYTHEVESTDEYNFTTEDANGVIHYYQGYGFTMWDAKTEKYITVPMQWSVLDMNGVSSPIAIDLMTTQGLFRDTLPGLLSSLLGAQVDTTSLASTVFDIIGGLDATLDGILNVQLPELIGIATGTSGVGQEGYSQYSSESLTVVPQFKDNGDISLLVMSTNVTRGNLGYMQLSWVKLNGALFAIMSVVGARNSLFIFGAISVALIFAAGLFREYAQKAKEDAKKKEEEDVSNGEATAIA